MKHTFVQQVCWISSDDNCEKVVKVLFVQVQVKVLVKCITLIFCWRLLAISYRVWWIIFACGRLSIWKTSIDLTCFSWSLRRLTFACVFYNRHLIPASLTLTVDLSISSMLLIATTWARHFAPWLQKQLSGFVFVQWKKHKLSTYSKYFYVVEILHAY